MMYSWNKFVVTKLFERQKVSTFLLKTIEARAVRVVMLEPADM